MSLERIYLERSIAKAIEMDKVIEVRHAASHTVTCSRHCSLLQSMHGGECPAQAASKACITIGCMLYE